MTTEQKAQCWDMFINALKITAKQKMSIKQAEEYKQVWAIVSLIEESLK